MPKGTILSDSLLGCMKSLYGVEERVGYVREPLPILSLYLVSCLRMYSGPVHQVRKATYLYVKISGRAASWGQWDVVISLVSPQQKDEA